MAEKINTETDNSDDSTNVNKCIPDSKVHWTDSYNECSVCLESCLQPVKLPCSHIFCYLCAKGVALNSGNCALCRREVDAEYFLSPVVVKVQVEATKQLQEETLEKVENDFQWYYEGRNGWWQYDKRTSLILEEVFQMKENSCNILVSGSTYVVDFCNMIQFRKDRPSLRRHVKRDVSGVDSKGVAGLKLKSSINTCDYCGKTSDPEIPTTNCLQCSHLTVDGIDKSTEIVKVEETDEDNCPPKKRRRKARKGK